MKLVILCSRVILYTQEIEVNQNVHLTDAVAQLIERLPHMRKIKVRAPVATEPGHYQTLSNRWECNGSLNLKKDDPCQVGVA